MPEDSVASASPAHLHRNLPRPNCQLTYCLHASLLVACCMHTCIDHGWSGSSVQHAAYPVETRLQESQTMLARCVADLCWPRCRHQPEGR